MTFGRAFRIAAIGLGVVTLVALAVCGVTVVRTRSFLAASTTTTGVVTALVPRQSCEDRDDDGQEDDCSTLYAPRVEFTAADGRTITFVASTASSSSPYTEGDTVEVRYRPERPADAEIDTAGNLWFGTIVTGFIALGFALACATFVVLAVKFRRI